ncbi:hypothetical protein [Shewanella sp.]|uniref:hypothetical protein n=1 Tax=Shewanella sp. TaxID=50422 RepID=UPI004054968A
MEIKEKELSEQLDIELIKKIFKQGYIAGRQDGLEGIFISSEFPFNQFLEQRYLLHQ